MPPTLLPAFIERIKGDDQKARENIETVLTEDVQIGSTTYSAGMPVSTVLRNAQQIIEYYRDNQPKPQCAVPDGWKLVPVAAIEKFLAATRTKHWSAVEALIEEGAELLSSSPEASHE